MLRVLVIVLTVLLGACLRPKPFRLKVGILPGANGNSPVALDIVSVGDKAAVDPLSKMAASEWFQKREQFRRDYPKDGALVVRSWEWVPGQAIPELVVPRKPKPRAVFLFANYASPGPHRARLVPGKEIIVTLGPEDMAIELKDK